MKKKISVWIVLAALACLCACGKEEPVSVETNSVIIPKKGMFTQAIVEDFSEPYYNADELKAEIENKIAAYNSMAGASADEAEKPIMLDRFELSEDKILHVYINYGNFKDYVAFNEKELFVGTVSGAIEQGYQFPQMKGANGEEDITASEVLEKGELGALILEEGQQILTPGNICYVSDGVTVTAEKTARNLNDGQKGYVIYKLK